MKNVKMRNCGIMKLWKYENGRVPCLVSRSLAALCACTLAYSPSVALAKEDRPETTSDIVIYGSSPAAISAAVQAGRMGKSAVVVSPETRIGGLTTGGLGQTDIGNKSAFGGIALEFYSDVAKWYADSAHWTRQTPEQYKPHGQTAGTMGKDSMWTFEPSAALAILEGWEKQGRLDIRRGEFLDREKGVEKQDGRIVSVKTLSGNVYRGKVFIDATYEGDLMAAAGVSYTVGRESNSVYGETISGIQFREAKSHQLKRHVSPYVVEGKPESGLLPGIEPCNPDEKDGDGDKRVQAYNFRMCLTDDPENRISFKKPANYDEREYELLFRNFANGETAIPWINSKMPNRKTDTNNRLGFSTDFIGRNYEWPEASYERRAEIFKAHLDYQQVLMWTLANHSRVPEKIRAEVSRWGTCKDEFTDGPGDGWQSQLYVREARRMVGEYVMTEHECRGDRVVPHPVAMGAYTMDSHNVRRVVTANGDVQNEGDVQDRGRYSAWGPDAAKRVKGGRMRPYGIDYGAITPKRGECENLLEPVCLSASHMAFGSIRMEPVFFALGQVAGTAAAMAAANGSAVQDVPYDALAARLVADGQVLSLDARPVASAAISPAAPDSPQIVRVAAANSSEAEKAAADFVCTGTNDEAVLTKAVETLTRGGTLKLADGDYWIDAFPNEGNTAVLFGYNEGRARTINVVGGTENKSYNTRFGVGIHVTEKAVSAMDPKDTYRLFCGTAKKPKAPGAFFKYTFVNNVNFRDIQILFYDASKPWRGIDGSCFGNMHIDMVGVYTEQYFNDRFLHKKPATPAKGSIGVVSCRGSNDEASRVGYDFVNVGGMHTGFLFQGVDHLVLKACTAARCCYGYRATTGTPKTMTWLNCCDEGNTHLPYFGSDGGHLTAIDFNIESFNVAYISDDPDGEKEHAAVEAKPGSWHGYISYTMQGKAFGVNRFWADGSGHNFRTVNLDHPMTSRPEHPEYLETYFDKATNKTLTWNGEMWVDAMGNRVD